MAEINFVQGLALDASYFGETDSITGQWNPKKYVGSYGTNGFYLNFSDNSGTTASTLGKDSSGNSNNFTPNNFSVAAGTDNDSVFDTPTNNFCTLNPLDKNSNATASDGNLKATGGSAAHYPIFSTFGMKGGKWYVELRNENNNNWRHSIMNFAHDGNSLDGDSTVSNNTSAVNKVGYGLNVSNGQKMHDSDSGSSYGSGLSGTSDVLQCAVDLDNGKIYWGINNTWFNSGDPAAGSNPAFSGIDTTITWTFAYHIYSSNGCTVNFGQQGFAYTPPTGFKALSSANLPDPTIKLPNKHFDTTLYTGNNSSQEISTLNFQPDWLWFKNRGGTNWHGLFDSVRGRALGLAANNKNSEYTSSASNDLVSFDDDGFTLGSNQNWGSVNGSGNNIVTWAWNGGGTDSKTYKVKVVADSTDYGHGTGSNKYQFFKSDGTTGFGTNGVDLDLEEGGTYIFDWSDSSAQNHPIRFSLTNDGTHSSGTSAGTEYTTGVTKDDSAYKTTITIASGVANLFYYCQNHSGMGAEINTNTTKGSTNFDGTTLAVVKANPTAGFSIVTYTGQQNASDTIGHGLGVKPQVVISKSRNATYTYTQWYVHHHKLTTNYFVFLNERNASGNGLGDYYIDGSFSSTVFAVGDDIYGPNVSNNNYVAYCFSEVEGYSSFGSYTGNGSSNGPFVYTGFRVSWLLVKADLSESWYIWDNKRDTFNAVDTELRVDEAYAETTFTLGDFTSNGFKIRQTDSALNQNGATYVYFAFAESPFKNARAR